MKPHILSKLQTAGENFHDLYFRHVRRTASYQLMPARQGEFEKIATGLINSLYPVDSRDFSPDNAVFKEGGPYDVFLRQEVRRYRDTGSSLEALLDLFKTVVQSLEHCIVELEAPAQEITAVLVTLRRHTDGIEKRLVADWGTSEIPHEIGKLKQSYPYMKDRLPCERGTSERPRAQTNQEKLQGAIFQSVGEGILLVDEDLEIINANQRAAEIYGIPPQNLIGMDVHMLSDEAGWRELAGIFDELVEGQRLSAEIAGIYVDGRIIPTFTTVTRIDYDGKKFWTIIVHDTTERKMMETRLLEEKRQTEEMNVTLKNVLNAIEKDRRDFENRLSARIRTVILPALQKAERESDDYIRNNYLQLLGHELVALTSGFDTELDAGLIKLTKTELAVCRLIQAGCASKEICEAMNLSFETILTHRKNIRRKLNLRGRKVNLQAFLSDRVVETHKEKVADDTERE